MEQGQWLGHYKLIFMDYSMPIMDGLETTSKIVEFLNEKGLDTADFDKSPYICCLSAYSEPRFAEKALEVGMHNFMTKPAKMMDVEQLLEDLNMMPKKEENSD